MAGEPAGNLKPPPSGSRQSSRHRESAVDALDLDKNRRPLPSDASGTSSPNGVLRDSESLLSNVVDGIIDKDRRKMRAQVRRYLSYASAILSCLCAGSISIFSLYGHLFLTRLHYSQYQVNAISIAAELALYLPVPIFGYLVDRYSPRPISLFAALLFCFGYVFAGFVYHAGPPPEGGWPVSFMMVAFVAIGMATSSMYLAATTACVKNFGRGKRRGLALSLPIASFSLSGMWQSQIGSQFFYEPGINGSRGDVDVFRFFLFLGFTLLAVGLVGAVAQVIVDEDELIDDTYEELERSGLLQESDFFRGTTLHDAIEAADGGYGTMSQGSIASAAAASWQEEEQHKKTWLLNGETRRFISDHTMWSLALGFFLLSGPVETYINNFGTIVDTLYPPPDIIPPSISAANQISILAILSTVSRFVAGFLSDLIGPVPLTASQYITPSAQYRSDPFDDGESTRPLFSFKGFTVSRLSLLLSTPLLLAISYILLLAVVPSQPQIFTLVTALIGLVNGISFSLVPILISTVWGVTNFGTNWGIVAMMPALGATVWSVVYSISYQAHTGPDGLCFGADCWAGAIGGMLGAAVLAGLSWTWTGWGKKGWWERGVIV